MFAEHTFAYKAFNALEKSSQVLSLALQLETFTSKVALWWAEVPIKAGVEGALTVTETAGAAARAPLTYAQIIGQYLKSIPAPWGMVAGIAAGAFFLSLLGSGGGATPPAGFTAEDQQKVQGSGQYYKNGVLTDTGSGALGDVTKKSTTIEDSLTLMEAHTFKNLDYSNKMLDALLAIKSNTANVGKAIANIPGILTAGEAINSGNWLTGTSSTEVLDKGIQAGGTIGQLRGGTGTLGTYSNTKSTSSGILGLSFLGGGTSYNPQSSLLPNTPAGKQLAESIQSLFDGAATAIGVAAEKLIPSLTAAGRDFGGKTAQSLIDSIVIDPEVFKISTMGLKGQELADAVSAQIGAAMDKAAAEAFPELDKFRSLGEGMGATVIRVIDGLDQVNLAMTSISKAAVGFGISGIEASQNLIIAAGGLDNLLANTSFFADNFLTSSERLAPIAAAVSKEMNSLGYASTTTQEQFKSLIQGFQFTDSASYTTYNRLLLVAEGFKQVTDATKSMQDAAHTVMDNWNNFKYGNTDATQARERAKVLAENTAAGNDFINGMVEQEFVRSDELKTRKQETEVMSIQGRTYDALVRTREDELKTMTSAEQIGQRLIYAAQDAVKVKSQELQIFTLLGNSAAVLQLTREAELLSMGAALRPRQEYIYALQDEATIKGKLTTAVKANVTSLQGFIKSLKDSRDALLLGAQSTLTPDAKYTESKAQLDAIVALTTSSDITARNDALTKLPAATASFLDASKILYASSAQYTQDFTSVLSILATTGTSLAAQESDAQRQLDKLGDIDLGVDETNRLISALITAQAATEAARLAASSGPLIGNKATISAGTVKTTSGWSGSIADARSAILANAGTTDETVIAVITALKGMGVDSNLTAQILNDPRYTASSLHTWALDHGIQGFAKGGLPKGLSLIGEQGPELVDFQTPARVYSNKASNDLLNNKELIQEIKSLRDEVSQLRAEQKEQTGHLIASNYDANSKAATKIADSTENAAATTAWNDRSKLKIA